VTTPGKPAEDDGQMQRAALIVATLSSFIGPFMSASVNVALPSISHDFAMGAILLSWVNTAFLLAAAAFLIPFGRLGDIVGRKRVYVWGLLVLISASVLVGTATSGTALIVFRVFQGLGSSMIFATGMPILVSVFPPGKRGKALGISVAAVYLGLSVGPFFGGLITQHLGWRWIFWTNVPLGLFLLLVIFRMLKGEWLEAKGAKFDAVGSVVLAVAMTATIYGFSSLPALFAIALIGFGLLGFVVFVRYESRIQHPILDLNLFRRNTIFAFSNLAALINYAATFAVTFLLSLFLQKTKGLSPQQTGLVLLAQPAMQTLFSPFAGRLSDRVEPRTIASFGMALTLVGLGMLAFLNAQTALLYIVTCLMILGIGFALFSSPNTNAIMSSVERRHIGIAGAMIGTMRQVGMVLSMGIVMIVLALGLGNTEINASNQDAFVHGMRIAFIVFAFMCLGGIFASLARGKLSKNNP
jgi:EmrB/QacA subfamily drug resistance transporter